jgi:hypothetical protein
MMPVEPLVSTVDAPVDKGDMGGGGDGEGGGGGGTSATVGDVTTASTAIETPVTLASMAVALLGLLVALAIVDRTEAAVTVVVWMLTSTMTLPGDTVNSTADGSTPARAATALCIWLCTLGVNEETSPPSSRVNPTILIAGGEGGSEGGGEGGGGESGGGECGGKGGGGEGGGGGGWDGGDGGGRGGGGGACGASAGKDGGGGEGEGGGGEGGGGEGGGGGARGGGGGGGEGEGGGGEGEGGGGEGAGDEAPMMILNAASASVRHLASTDPDAFAQIGTGKAPVLLMQPSHWRESAKTAGNHVKSSNEFRYQPAGGLPVRAFQFVLVMTEPHKESELWQASIMLAHCVRTN